MEKKFKVIKQEISKVATQPGVYIFYDKSGVSLYVGKSRNLRLRVASYFGKHIAPKTKAMMEQATDFSLIIVKSEFEALLLEANLVKKLMPKYNSALKDDKSPLYIGITKEKYPRILTLRQTDLLTNSLREVFGPFIDGGSVKLILRRLRRVFSYCTHKLGKRACIEAQINLCKPCPNVIDKLTNQESQKKAREEYLGNITSIRKILRGKFPSVRIGLQAKMKEYSRKKEFEQAMQIHNQIKMLDYVVEQRVGSEQYLKNPNLLEDIRGVEASALHKALSKHLKVSELVRIECFDIAHLAGSYPTASMVTFVNGEPEKKYYRHFRLRETKGNDDVASMREVLGRRAKHFSTWGKPDLLIVDGGKGQLNAALDILGDIVPIIGLAKREEIVYMKINSEFVSLRLDREALWLIQRLRDESHRFARRYHHKLVSVNLLKRKNNQ